MTRRRRSLRLLGMLLAVLALGFGLSACGDDDDDTGSASGSASEADAGGEGGDVEAYCEKTLEIETIPEPDIDFESLSPEEQAEEAKKFANDELLPLAEEIEANAPSEIADHIATLVGVVEEIAETGNFEVFDSPEAEEASDAAHAFDLENCGWSAAPVTATEYKFEGLAAEYEAGPTSFDFRNEGKELHEFILLKKKDDTSETFDQLLELPEDEAQEKVEEVASTFGEPGDDDYVVADLDEGEYMAICFIPTGLTPEAAKAAEEGGEEPQGPPHFTQGMKSEFTVG
jgi:hypothetical protein